MERLTSPGPGAWLRRSVSRLPAFTREGQVVAFMVMSVTTGLIVSGHLLLYFALAVALALMTVGFLYPYLNLWRLFVRRSVPPHAFADEPVFIELAVANRKRHVPSFSLVLEDDKGVRVDRRDGEVHLPAVGAGRAQRTGYYLCFPRRGAYRWRYIKVSSSFPFLLFRRKQLIRFPSELTIYPRPGRLLGPLLPEPVGSLRRAHRRARGFQDFHKLREYRPGDDVRLIHWKSSARRGDMLLREFDAEGGESVLVVLDPVPEGSVRYGARTEQAISFLVTAVKSLWSDGYRVSVATFGDRYYQHDLARQRPDWHALLGHLAHYDSCGDHAPSELVSRVKLPRREETALLWITDRVDRTEDSLRRLWPTGAPVRVVSSNDARFGELFEVTRGKVRW